MAGRPPSADVPESIYSEYLEGTSIRQLAKKYQVSYGTIHRRLTAKKIKMRKPGGFRRQNSVAKSPGLQNNEFHLNSTNAFTSDVITRMTV